MKMMMSKNLVSLILRCLDNDFLNLYKLQYKLINNYNKRGGLKHK